MSDFLIKFASIFCSTKIKNVQINICHNWNGKKNDVTVPSHFLFGDIVLYNFAGKYFSQIYGFSFPI